MKSTDINNFLFLRTASKTIVICQRKKPHVYTSSIHVPVCMGKLLPACVYVGVLAGESETDLLSTIHD